jgi:hypothetical protein
VPFNPFRRKPPQAVETARPAPPPRPGPVGSRPIPFEGLTEEWRLVGVMHLTGRLSDALNRRDPIPLADVHWAPMAGTMH